MRQRLLKYLKRFLIVILVLGIVGLAAFTWLFYWPLEGSVDDMLRLVPHDVEFVLRADYEDLEATGWVQGNVLDDPLHPDLGTEGRKVLEMIARELETIQGQVDEQSPVAVDIAEFVEGHVLRGEICIAGRWWEHASPDQGPPQWKELLVLKRVSRLARCISGLQHGFIRERVQLGPTVELSAESDGVFRFTLHEMKRPRNGRRGRRMVDEPDMSEWYVARVQDVIAVSNRRELIDRVQALHENANDPDSFATRPGFDIEQRAGRVVAAVNVDPLHSYFRRVFDHYPGLKPLRRFLPPEALEKLSGSISLEGRDVLSGGARISYIQGNADEVARNVYNLAERPVGEGIADMVPAKDTFAVLTLRCNAEYLLDSLVDDILEPGDRRLWEDNLRKMGEFDSLEEFFEDLSTRMGDQAMVALARNSKVFDRIEFPDWWSGDTDPMPSLAIMVRIREGANQAELDEYLASKIPLLGFSKQLEKVAYKGFHYSKSKLEERIKDYELINPCFILAKDHMILTTTEDYMRQILDTVSDREANALSQDETFRVTMGSVPERGHVGIFVDLEKLTRVPEETRWEPEPMMGPPGTRGFAWDTRNQWVITNKDDREEAIRKRREVSKRFPARPNLQQQLHIDKLVDEHMEQWIANYPRFVEEFRLELETYRRLRGFGAVLGATQEHIDANFALVFQPGEGWLHWRR